MFVCFSGDNLDFAPKPACVEIAREKNVCMFVHVVFFVFIVNNGADCGDEPCCSCLMHLGRRSSRLGV